MGARLGWLLYWVGCGAAALMVLAGAVVLAVMPKPEIGLFVVFAAIAALIFAAGRGARYVLAGR